MTSNDQYDYSLSNQSIGAKNRNGLKPTSQF